MRKLAAGLVCVMLFCASARAVDEEPGGKPELAEIKAGYEAAMAATRDISVASSKVYTQLPWVSPAIKMSPSYVPPRPGPHFYFYARSGERYGWWYYPDDTHWKRDASTDWTVTDGETSLHVTDEREDPRAREPGRAIKTARKVGVDVDAGTALMFTGWYNGVDLMAAFASETVSIDDEPVEIDGVETWVVSYEHRGMKGKFYIAPERSWLPVRRALRWMRCLNAWRSW